MSDNNKHKVKIGSAYNLVFTVKDENNQPVDLTGKSVLFTIKKDDVFFAQLSPCSLLDQTTNKGQGYFRVTQAISETFVHKTTYNAEVCVVDGADISFYPNSFSLKDDYIEIFATQSLATP